MPRICSRCQAENPPAANYCSSCGEVLLIQCARCGEQLKEGINFCPSCGQAVHPHTSSDEARRTRLAAAAPGDLIEKARSGSLASELKIATVLFADVVDSTGLANQLDSETWQEILSGAFDRILPPIYRYEGTIARTQGDALIAFFGSPVTHEDDPLRAVQAAMDAREQILEYAQEAQQRFGIEFRMRFCLNTGPIVVGPVDRALIYEFSEVFGTVNLTARIKFAGPANSVLVSESTHRFIAPLFNFERLGKIEVSEPHKVVEVYRVVAAKLEPGSLRGISGLHSPMVGRERELQELLRLTTAVHSGLGRVCAILGEPGLGKTRLVLEWQTAITSIGRSPAPQWAEGRSLSYGRGMAYHLILRLLRSLLGVSERASKPEVHAALRSVMLDLFNGLEQPPALEIHACLGSLLGLDMGEAALEFLAEIEPQAMPAHYLVSMRKFLAALSQERPIILVIEDLHWCDPSSADLFSGLLPLVNSLPLLICLVSRQERESPGWKLIAAAREMFGNSLTELNLAPLSEPDSRQLVANLLELEKIPEDVRASVLSKAEGNPFFVEEIVRMLIEQGAIIQQDQGWVACEEFEDLHIPDNLQGLLMARIDRLSDEGKLALRVASVVGRQFPAKVLQQVLVREERNWDSDRGHPLGVLTDLESTGLIRVAQYEPELEYLFRHSLVHEAAYASILTADRRKLHQAVGESVEQIYPKQVNSRELAPQLGQHFSEGGDEVRALKYFQAAGDAALSAFADQEAEGFFRKGLAIPCSNTDRIKLLTGLGEALNNQSHYLEAIDAWKEAIWLTELSSEESPVAKLFAWSARAAWWGGNTPYSLELCLEGIEKTSGSPASPDKALLIHETARASYFNGVQDQARSFCLQALEMSEQLGDTAVQAESLTTLAILPGQSPEASSQALNQAIELAEAAGLLKTAGRAHINAGSMRRGLFGDMDGALFHYQKTFEFAQRRGVVKEQLFALGAILSIYLDLGQLNKLQEMQPLFEELISSLNDQRAARLELNHYVVVIQVMRGEWYEAQEPLQNLIQEARRTGNLWGLIDVSLTSISGAIEAYWRGEPVELPLCELQIGEIIDLCERGMGNKAAPLAYQAILRVIQGRLDDARQAVQAAEQAATGRHEIWVDILLWYSKGVLATAEKSWQAAFLAFEEAYNYVIRSNQRWVGGRILLRWADSLIQRGEPADLDKALGLLREAAALFESIQAPVYLGFIEQQRRKTRQRMLSQATDQNDFARELTQAGRIQRSFLPDHSPDLPGWSLAAVILPARETSGDYYDFIPLPNGRLGIVIADVADKGAGAALFMASSRTLIRTYTGEYPSDPARVMEHTNHRLLQDTHAGLFVTMFYAVLDPKKGSLHYCNAGHNPPFVFRQIAESEFEPASLTKTGIPLGIFQGAEWETDSYNLQPGDLLVLYTDGVTEAQNPQGEYYEDKRITDQLMLVIRQNQGVLMSADQALSALVEDINAFIAGAPRTDDLTLVILGRGSDNSEF